MFRADAETDDASRDAPEVWDFSQQAHCERRVFRRTHRLVCPWHRVLFLMETRLPYGSPLRDN